MSKLEEAEAFDQDEQVRQAIVACRTPAFEEATPDMKLALLRQVLIQHKLTSSEFTYIGRQVGAFPPLEVSDNV